LYYLKWPIFVEASGRTPLRNLREAFTADRLVGSEVFQKLVIANCPSGGEISCQAEKLPERKDTHRKALLSHLTGS
jgi:hypothetical protein